MPDNTQDTASLRGRGADILLPAKGNPFGSGETPAAPETVFSIGAEANAPQGLPEMPMGGLPEMPMGGSPDAGMTSFDISATGPEPPAAPEPTDLTPEDLAAMFPSSHDDRSLAPESITPVSEADLKASTLMGSDAELAGHEALMAVPAPTTLPQPPGTTPVTVTVQASSPPGDASTGAVAGSSMQASATFAVPQGFQVADNVGLGLDRFNRDKDLPANPQLLNLLLPDKQLIDLWAEIDSVEKEVVNTSSLSQRLAEQLVDRLAEARNRLMADRGQYEEAVRQVSNVKYQLNRSRHSSLTQQPRIILVYQLLFLVLLVVGFVAVGRLNDIFTGKGTPLDNFIWAVLTGGVGGVTGALYGLWVHVSRDQDYEPQFALWYYSNPLIGLLLGGLVHILLLAGMLTAAGGQSVAPSPYAVWVLAFAVGFQQNLALSLLNSVLKKFIPQDEKGSQSQTAKPPQSNK